MAEIRFDHVCQDYGDAAADVPGDEDAGQQDVGVGQRPQRLTGRHDLAHEVAQPGRGEGDVGRVVQRREVRREGLLGVEHCRMGEDNILDFSRIHILTVSQDYQVIPAKAGI